MPEDVQEVLYRTVPGLENAKLVRPAYGVESKTCAKPESHQLGDSTFATGQAWTSRTTQPILDHGRRACISWW